MFFGTQFEVVAANATLPGNEALHIAAVTQIRNLHSEGRGYYDGKLAEGKTPREARRALEAPDL